MQEIKANCKCGEGKALLVLKWYFSMFHGSGCMNIDCYNCNRIYESLCVVCLKKLAYSDSLRYVSPKAGRANLHKECEETFKNNYEEYSKKSRDDVVGKDDIEWGRMFIEINKGCEILESSGASRVEYSVDHSNQIVNIKKIE